MIIGLIWQSALSGEVAFDSTWVGEYLLYGSMVFGIYWGVRRFIHNKGLAIITALIPIIILRLVVAAMTGFIVRPI